MAAAKAAAEETAPKTTQVVKYVGTADVREIDAASWKSVGVEDQGKVSWDSKNKWTIPTADLSKSALEYFTDDASFVITEA